MVTHYNCYPAGEEGVGDVEMDPLFDAMRMAKTTRGFFFSFLFPSSLSLT